MKGQPAFVAMQAEGREWVTMFSKQTRAKFDYVFTDGMTWSNPAGKRMRLWIPEEVEIGPDEQAFMDLLVSKIVGILETEPIDIYVNATFLPAAIAPRYDALWTEERMTRVIDAAVKNGVAIEIGARYKIPSEAFLRLAKEPRREVHVRDEQRRRERPRRLVLPARHAEEARPQVVGHVRPRPPAEPRTAGVGARCAPSPPRSSS